MRNRIIYGIIKTYKGIFIKTHVGNVQIFIIEMEKKFWVLNVLGEMETGIYVAQQLLSAPSEYIHSFIDGLEEDENYVQIEEIFCDIPKESEDEFIIMLKKKGTHLLSNYTVSFSNDYSHGNIRIYLIKGTFNPLIPDKFQNRIELKMSALKQRSIANPLISKFINSIK